MSFSAGTGGGLSPPTTPSAPQRRGCDGSDLRKRRDGFGVIDAQIDAQTAKGATFIDGMWPLSCVGDTGFEPVTSSVSRKRAPTAPIALDLLPCTRVEVETGFEPVYTALQAVASPLGHSTEVSPRDYLAASERTTGLEPATLTLAR